MTRSAVLANWSRSSNVCETIMLRTPAGRRFKNNLRKSLSCEPLSPNNERVWASSLDGDVISLYLPRCNNRSSLLSLDGAKFSSKTLLALLYTFCAFKSGSTCSKNQKCQRSSVGNRLSSFDCSLSTPLTLKIVSMVEKKGQRPIPKFRQYKPARACSGVTWSQNKIVWVQ